MKLIVGLGNPGKKYEKTRHNAGFMVLDALHREWAEEYNLTPWEISKKFNAEISGCTIGHQQFLLVKPMTFMNDSGVAVQLLGHFYKLSPRDILVIHDEKDLPLGEIKVQSDRGHAGHNGVRSIVDHIGSKDFTRVRVGIATEKLAKMDDTAKFVLGKFGIFEKKKVEAVVEKAIEEIEKLVAVLG